MKYAEYIEEIEIDSLWSGLKHIKWTLDPKVNILSGINGVGKSTILNRVVRGLMQGGEFASNRIPGVRMKVMPEDAGRIRYDVIRSFRPSAYVRRDDEQGYRRLGDHRIRLAVVSASAQIS